MFNNANVIFRTKFVDGVSTVTRTVNDGAAAAATAAGAAARAGSKAAAGGKGAAARGASRGALRESNRA
jgi:structural maintenance of chromosome 2